METPNLFDLRVNDAQTLLKFDQQLPIYNWYYPFPEEDNRPIEMDQALSQVKRSDGRRALYFHIPFCDTICTFCPFYRSARHNKHELIDRYVDAIVREVELKSQFDGISKVPVDVISFGGGTPSVLSIEQIQRIGEAIHKHFDLSNLIEWTFECEVKSVTREKLEALKAIGVTRISFGVQTLNPKYRKLFNLTSTLEQVENTAKWATELFDYVNIDIIYGMAGQSLDELIEDVEKAMKLNTTTIDLYPLNNMAASLALHQMAAKEGLEPVSHATKVSFRIFMDEYMRAKGYVPVTGFTYAKAREGLNEYLVIDETFPAFHYHDAVFGYDEDQVIAYGASGFSQASGVNVYNVQDTELYIDVLLNEGILPAAAYENLECPEKGIVYFPYRGTLIKNKIKWDLIPEETRLAFEESLAKGLVEDAGDVYRVTRSGWLFYVNYIYFLMPQAARQQLSGYIANKIKEGRPEDHTRLYQIELEELATL